MLRNLLGVFANVGGMNEHLYSNTWTKNKWIFPPSIRCNNKHRIPKSWWFLPPKQMHPSTNIQISMMELEEVGTLRT